MSARTPSSHATRKAAASVTSICWNVKSGSSRWWATLSKLPIERLSMAITRSPRAINASTTCEPMKPAAPVTATASPSAMPPIVAATNCYIAQPGGLDRLLVEHIATVQHELATLEPRPLEAKVLGVIRLQDDGIDLQRPTEVRRHCPAGGKLSVGEQRVVQ